MKSEDSTINPLIILGQKKGYSVEQNEISLKKMIYNLMDDEIINGLTLNDDTEIAVTEIINNRNEVTHSCKFIANNKELADLNDQMRIILEISILRYLDFSQESIKSIILRNLRYLRILAAKYKDKNKG